MQSNGITLPTNDQKPGECTSTAYNLRRALGGMICAALLNESRVLIKLAYERALGCHSIGDRLPRMRAVCCSKSLTVAVGCGISSRNLSSRIRALYVSARVARNSATLITRCPALCE